MTSLQSVGVWFRREILRDRSARWNHQYAAGRWEGLKAPVESARLDACVALLRRHAAGGRLLEIGCGEALLQLRLAPNDYQCLVGVDISAVAIARAQSFAGNRVRYLVADMRGLRLDEKFDAVVFTESIYYDPRPDQLLRKYVQFLGAGGVFIVSIFRNKGSADTWARIHSVTDPVDRITTKNEAGVWDCEVLRLR